MSLNQLKRALWVMNELVNSGPCGISYSELSRKWLDSPVNDRGEDLSERTFYRLRKDLESLFDVDIKLKSTTDNRYIVTQTEYSMFLGLFCRMITDNSKYRPSLQDLMLQVMRGMEISTEEKKMIEEIAFKLNRLAYETLRDLIEEVNGGTFTGADRAQWADIKYHICIWLEDTFQRLSSWVGVGIDRKGEDGKGCVKFYIVNETDDEELHALLMKELNLLSPERLDGKFWWFAPREESSRTLSYSSKPDMGHIRKVVENLCRQINSIQSL